MREDQCNKVSHTGPIYDGTTACTRARANAPNTVYWQLEGPSGEWWSDRKRASFRERLPEDMSPDSRAGIEKVERCDGRRGSLEETGVGLVYDGVGALASTTRKSEISLAFLL